MAPQAVGIAQNGRGIGAPVGSRSRAKENRSDEFRISRWAAGAQAQATRGERVGRTSQPAEASPAKPMSIIAQVEASGAEIGSGAPASTS